MEDHLVFDVRDFAREVVERSRQVPVVADFWAEWCGPCKMLSPVLERLAAQGNGAWVLAKVDTEEHPELSMQFGIQGIPNVKLFHQGKVVGEFMGAMPEPRVRQWLEKNLPRKSASQVDEALSLLAAGRTDEAGRILDEVIGLEPGNQQAKALRAKTLVYSDPGRAKALIAGVDDPRHDEIRESVRTLLRLFDAAAHPETLPEARPAKERYLEAIADLKGKRFEQALQKFIGIIRDDRPYDDDGSRKACIAIFKFLGEEHPITINYRREFSRALYV